MDELIANFPRQLERAMEIGEDAEFSSGVTIHNVLITGLGGSGIGGTIISEIVQDKLKVPVVVNKTYHIPEFVNENTLVVVSSYSGNTEETYSALREAFAREAKIICITSGGKIGDFARSNGLDLVIIDGGMPPRSCFGYSFVQQLYALFGMKLITEDFKRRLRRAIALLDEDQDDIRRQARDLAGKLVGKLPVIYADAAIEGVATRFRQQINENAKMLCWHHVIPEMNHNELVGWRGDYNNMAVVLLRNEDDYVRDQSRMEYTKQVAGKYCNNIYEVWSKGKSRIEKTLYLIHLTDWASYYIAEKTGVDAVEVDVITGLKNELEKKPMN